MDNIVIIRSSRKTAAIRVKHDCTVEVRVPLRMSREAIEEFVRKNQAWIEKNVKKMQESAAKAQSVQKLSPEEIKALAEKALEIIPERTAYFARIIGVTYGRITIRCQKSRWGSCSGKGNLNFNCLLMLMPPDVIDYVVVHELCHRKEMNHSPKFWAEVRNVLPGYMVQYRWLSEHGSEIMMKANNI